MSTQMCVDLCYRALSEQVNKVLDKCLIYFSKFFTTDIICFVIFYKMSNFLYYKQIMRTLDDIVFYLISNKNRLENPGFRH